MNPTFTTNDFIRIASTVAEHYGFDPIQQISKDPLCRDCPQTRTSKATAKDRKKDALHGLLTNGSVAYCENGWHQLERPIFSYSLESVPRTGEIALSLQVFHVEKSIAEAVLIQAGRTLLSELGFADHTVYVNSLGDQESHTRYIRELTNFFRKRIEYLPLTARELMKEHVILSLLHLIEKEHEIAYKAPNPLEYLSDTSRKHFREIIEYLDMSDAPYEINPLLLGHHECYSDTLFTIETENTEYPLVIRGGRYQNFMQRHTAAPTPAVGAVLIVPERKIPTRVSRPRLPQPDVFVVHLGFGPRVRTLLLVDELRQAGIPVLHAIATDSLSAQLREAERLGCAYTVIIGQKEYVENSVILRDMLARNQETISQDQLHKKLKRSYATTS